MRVYLDEYGGHGYGADVIVVDLDDGTHVSAWCIVDNPGKERADLERHMKMVINEAIEKLSEENKRLDDLVSAWKDAHRAADLCLFSSRSLHFDEMCRAADYARKMEEF